jgi:deoxyribodipyrimidine photo-lyase
MRGGDVVWFKRDLRVVDHAPLLEACARGGPVVALFIAEPSVWSAEDADPTHWTFVAESLAALDAALASRGGWLVVRVGEAVEVLADLHAAIGFTRLWSHEETGNALTYARDRAVKRWARDAGVAWGEAVQNGVVRGLRDRDGWARRWEARMGEPALPPPLHVPSHRDVPPTGIPQAEAIGMTAARPGERQTGGWDAAERTLASFLDVRGVNYRADMASPVSGWEGCSRLSPYLAWGCVSLRTVHHATTRRQRSIAAHRHQVDPRWAASLHSFQGRLRWHCHFMQKLEDEPALEFHDMNPAFEGLRSGRSETAALAAWSRGETGYPMVDASMRCLAATGWLNFRMRAMVVSFAAWDLGLHWRPVSLVLARLFLDYEPGIHYSQCQMQSGTTGINATRIYSPTRQALDNDPDGHFRRRWLPELASVPLSHLAEPWTLGPLDQRAIGCIVGETYPEPIVDHAVATREMRRRWSERRYSDLGRAASEAVYERHGSRRGARERTRKQR